MLPGSYDRLLSSKSTNADADAAGGGMLSERQRSFAAILGPLLSKRWEEEQKQVANGGAVNDGTIPEK